MHFTRTGQKNIVRYTGVFAIKGFIYHYIELLLQ